MKLTKKLEAEILEVYKTYWDAFLKGDIRSIALLVDDNCHVIGSSVGEVFNDKRSLLKYLKATIGQIKEKAELRNRKISVTAEGKDIMVNDQSDLYVLIDDTWTFYGHGRASTLFSKKANKWKIIHLHRSLPDSKAGEGEQVNTEKIKAENIQLRDAVKRRTEELESKNRELEIEAALERVRARAMAMQSSDELIEVANVLRQQMVELGQSGFDTAAVHLYPEDSEYFDSWYSFRQGDPVSGKIVTGKTRFKKDECKMLREMVKAYHSKQHDYTLKASGEKLKEWFSLLTKAIPEIRINLDKNLRSNYIHFSDFSGGSLVIATFQPPTQDSMILQKRCAIVFDLAYRRYLDLKKAEAQAKEARIELALERVRARAMAMHNSDELAELVATVFKELTHLDFKLTSCIIWIHDHEKAMDILWIASAEMNKPAKPFQVTPFHNGFFGSIVHAWKAKDPKWVYAFTGVEKKKFEKAFFKELPNLPDALKKALNVPKQVVFSASFNNFGGLEIVETEALTDEKFEILHRFGKVFDLSYTRFNDLKKAEAQTREAQIETALERVRSKTMAMHKSEEVTGIAVSLNEELLKLGFDGGSTIMIIDKETGDTEQWTGFSEDKTLQSCYVPYFKHPSHDSLLDAWKRGEKFLVYTLKEKEKKTFDEHYFKTGYKNFPESDKKWMRQMGSVTFSYAFMKYGAIHWGPGHLTEEQLKILQRFAKVFEQSYTRFLDLQKAEAQAKEAKIEAALERVRGRSMAMHKSDDLHEVIKVVVEQLSVLRVKFNVSNFAKIDPDGSWDLWLSTPEQTYPALVHVPYIDHPIFSRITEEGTKGNDFFTDVYTREEANIFFHHFFENTIAKNSPEERKQFVYNSKGFTRSLFLTKNIWFSVGRYDAISFSDEENAIFKRFANVFEQAYTRFLDLQKAEAQAREADIELSLERVRAKTMAMQKPSEFVDVINIIGEQFVHLGFDIDWANFGANGFAISEGIDIWNFAVIPGGSPIAARVFIPYFDHPVFTTSAENIDEFLNGGRDLITVTFDKQTKDTWLDQLFTKTIFKDVPQEYRVFQYAKPGYTTSNISIKDTWLSIGKFDSRPFTDEQHLILRRFANAFGQANTRFLDLQKAEAQAREAQIEASLERVRSRAMAMQNSDELRELIGTVFTELTKLDISLTRCLIMIYDPRSNDSVWWMANSEAPTEPIGLRIQNHEHPPYTAYLKAWQEKKLNWVYVLEGAVKKDWDDFLFVETELSHLPDFVIAGMKAPERVYLNSSFNSFGNLTLASLEALSNEHFDILLRFAKVFDLTYTRFNDLEKAEAQTKEAQIELALERVRARTMAMHKSEELAETAQVLFQQLSELGGMPDRISIGIADEINAVVNFWSTDQSGTQINQSFPARLNEPTTIAKIYEAWKANQRSFTVDLQGDELKSWIQYAREVMGIVVKDDHFKNRRVHHVAFFSHGWILVTTHEPQSAETLQILERFASVFNLTYRRFLDLQKAEAQANEARIEIALERIRARALAMHKSDELMEVANVLREQMALLGQPELESSVVHLYEEDPDHILSWRSYRAKDPQSKIGYGHMAIPKNCCEVVREWLTKFHSELKEYTIEISGAKQKEWYEILFKLAPDVVNSMRQENSIHEKRYYRFTKFSGGALLMVSKQEPSEEVTYLQRRAAVVFDLAYRRFSDLQKAEAQAREAQIETALEKVRSRSLAMHKSDELQEVVDTVFERLQDLNFEMASANIAIFKEGTRNYDYWIASPAQKRSASFHMPYKDISLTRDLIAARESGKEFSTTAYSFEEKNEWFGYAFKDTDFKFLNEDRKQFILNAPGITVAIAFSKNTGVQVNRYTSKLYTEGEGEILKRFSKVFEQAYIRFLDLEKAEAQAREAQIEASLERVRASAMAMHRSDELSNVLAILFEQFDVLKIQPVDVHLDLFDLEKNTFSYRATGKEGKRVIAEQIVDLDSRPEWQALLQKWKNGKPNTVDFSYYPKEVIRELMAFFPDIWAAMPEDAIMSPEDFPDGIFDALGYCKFGYIGFHHHRNATEEEQRILIRFANEFERLYQRFLDLQKAEAQAKEAQIEASLERVRSKTMAMHNSQDVGNTVATMFDQLVYLGVKTNRCGILIFSDTNHTEVWTAKSNQNGEAALIIGHLDVTIHPMLHGVRNAWKNKETFFSYELAGENIKDYYNAINNYPEYPTRFNLDSLPTKEIHSDFFFPEGAVFAFTSEPITAEASQIFKRFAGVFGQTYRRFLDLLKAEAQAKEAQIEASLERVRSKTMAMHNSQDVGETVAVMFDELRKLDIETLRCGVGIMLENYQMELWTARPDATGMAEFIVGHIDMKLHPLLTGGYEAWKNRAEGFFYQLKDEDLKTYFDAINSHQAYPAKYDISSLPSLMFHYEFNFNEGCLFAFSRKQFSDESSQIFKRFTGVFGQTYRRYLDLLKAESNAREAQIEAGLERVRAKAMAMHSSKDLAETLSVFYRELKSLSVVPIRCGVALMDKESRMAELTTMNTTGEGDSIEIIGKIKMTGHPVLDGVFENWLVQKEYHAVLRGNQIKEYYQVLKPQIDYLDYSHDEAQFGYYFMFKEGDVYAWTEKELTEDELTIYRRFTTVISLTYKRYKDLQQAEAQAKEAKIEAGLERVRARTMAMHNSEDVGAATATMFTELEKLGIQNLRGGITVIKAGDKQEVWGITNLPDGRTIRSIGEFDMHLHPLWRELLKAKLNKGDYNYYRLAGKDKEDYINILNATPNYLSQPIKEFPDVHVQSYFFGEGAIWTNSLQPHSEEDKQTMKRFASVFSLTFRRYQDLQKAEAQAREATIEAALERVRGKAMAMHSSKDLASTIGVFYHELEGLDLTPRRCGIGLINKETKRAEISTMNASADGEGIEMVGNLDFGSHPVLTGVYNNWLSKTEYHPVLRGNEIKEYYQVVRPQIDFPDYPNDTVQYGYFFFFDEGGVYAWTEKELSEEELKIYRRFTSVLSLTYKRYKDLKDAEASAQAAIKDAALDRIRADIASMRTINDLDRITPLIWNELTILGIPFIRCGVFIMDEEQQLIHTFLSTPDGKAIAAFHLPYDTPGNLNHVVSNWKIKNKYIDHWDESEFKQFAEILMKQGALVSAEQYLKTIPKGGFYLHFLPFLQGMLYVGNTTQLEKEEIELIQHVADAFSTAYARYEDFNKLEAAKQQVEKTLTDLKQAQTQLVQSEKMASLGEMTAGIAHEIQNPLNFVNNFSEVSKELLDEMKTELETGNTEDAKGIADDVIQNLEKINHHGKRADAIVKSMLQHSRSSSGKKEPADINGLADEYLRLAYHGLRAKDKSFNAKFETEFDSSIGKINIISQDIGRVLVNLINNAFYAVSERKKQESNGYEPTVTVYTKKIDDKIEIKVRDNGNGIPQKVLDKIFQPFFTTKPTGQGTGLGLSLAYDIVTKGHGGELKVETKEGEGSEFIIQIPMN